MANEKQKLDAATYDEIKQAKRSKFPPSSPLSPDEIARIEAFGDKESPGP